MSSDSAASAAAPAQFDLPECKSEQEVIEHYNRIRQEQSNFMTRIAQTEAERHEHNLVVETLEPLEPTRKCHNLVGGVLVERTVAEVLPMIKQSLGNLDLLLKNLGDALSKNDQLLDAFMTKYKIRARGSDQKVEAAASEEGGSKSVLA